MMLAGNMDLSLTNFNQCLKQNKCLVELTKNGFQPLSQKTSARGCFISYNICLILFYISFYLINCQWCCRHMETSQMICTADRLTGLCVGATLAVNGIISECHSSQLSRTSFSIDKKKKTK